MIESIIIGFLASVVAVAWVHPYLVKIAHLKNIVDNPNARKLQRIPVPILGGLAVFFGVVLGIGIANLHVNCSSLMIIITAMMIMLYLGAFDDVLELSPSIRFVLEIGVVLLLIFSTKLYIEDFHGLWGISIVDSWIAIPLTVFAAVGIINAINLIDGVDGLSSGYCIMASIAFGSFFYITGNQEMLILAATAAGSLIPFFLHNVFGKTSKMFIGDSGTLVMGIILSSFVVNTISTKGPAELLVGDNFGFIPFTLAVMSIPIFDTLRVMTSRILRHTSPFHPDKTHLHHLFIDFGFSHPGTTVSILTINSLIILMQWLTWKLGGSVDVQLYVVIALGILSTWGLYHFAKPEKDCCICKILKRLGKMSHIERKGAFLTLQKFIDKL